jgi:hypothetical protein
MHDSNVAIMLHGPSVSTSYILATLSYSYKFFLIGIVGGGVQLGPLGTTATNRPILPTPGDYHDGETGGMMIGKGNRSTRKKSASVPLCLPQNPHAAQTRTRAVLTRLL